MPKLGSKKSRAGCVNCKRRRVKCDETRPRCSACTKYGMNCAYIDANTAIANVASRNHHFTYPHTVGTNDGPAAISIARPSTSLHVLADAASSVDDDKTPVSLNGGYELMHLELLHHFLTKTIATITRPNSLDCWRTVIPDLAYSRPWLMNGMLAVAGLHRTHCIPSKAGICVPMAMDLLNSGLPTLHSWVQDIEDPSGTYAIAAYAILVSIYAIALPAVQYRRQPPADPIAALLEVFDLMRGTAYIFELTWDALRDGALKPITQIDVFKNVDHTITHTAPTPQRRQTLEHLQKLEQLLHETSIPEEVEEINHCKKAYDRLNRIAHNVLMPNEQVHGNLVLAWAGTLTGDFRRLLREQYPPAITILAYYCLLLRDDCWFLKGWRSWTLNSLGKISLPSPWHEMFHWAEDQVQADAEFLDLRQPVKVETATEYQDMLNGSRSSYTFAQMLGEPLP